MIYDKIEINSACYKYLEYGYSSIEIKINGKLGYIVEGDFEGFITEKGLVHIISRDGSVDWQRELKSCVQKRNIPNGLENYYGGFTDDERIVALVETYLKAINKADSERFEDGRDLTCYLVKKHF